MIKEFFYKNFLILLGTHLGSFLTFLSQIIILRNLNYNQVSITLSLIAMFGIINIPLSVMTKIIVNYLSEEFKIGERQYLLAVNNSKKVFLLFTLIIILLYAILHVVIFNYLKIDNPYYLYFFIPIAIIANMYLNIYLAMLQAKQEFIKYVFMSNLNFLVRFIILIALIIIISFNTYTVLYSIPISILITMIIFCVYNDRKNFLEIFKIKEILDPNFKKIYSLIFKSKSKIIIFSILFYYLFIDQIVVKNIFPNEINSIYIKTSIIAKLIFYLPAPISIFLLSKNSGIQKNAEFYYKSSIAMTGLISAILIMVIYYFNELISNILLGSSDKIDKNCLLILMIGMFFYSMINIIFTQLVARSNFQNLYLLILIALSFFVLSKYSSNIYEYAITFSGTLAFTFFITLIFCFKKIK